MTQEKFINWLEGYLDGKEHEVNSNDSLKKIKEKMGELHTLSNSYSISYGNTPSYISTSTNSKFNSKQLLTENED